MGTVPVTHVSLAAMYIPCASWFMLVVVKSSWTLLRWKARKEILIPSFICTDDCFEIFTQTSGNPSLHRTPLETWVRPSYSNWDDSWGHKNALGQTEGNRKCIWFAILQLHISPFSFSLFQRKMLVQVLLMLTMGSCHGTNTCPDLPATQGEAPCHAPSKIHYHMHFSLALWLKQHGSYGF